MTALLEGIVIGVSAGLITTFIMGIFGWAKHLVEKHNQRIYLVRTIVHYRSMIYEAEAFKDKVGTVEKAQVQKAYFDEFRREMESVLQGRVSRLSYDEVRAIRKVFFTDLFPQAILNDANYKALFGSFETIKWLKLPHRSF